MYKNTNKNCFFFYGTNGAGIGKNIDFANGAVL